MIRFTKMHGLGNDYVYIDCIEERLDGVDVAALARAMSDRHRGIGSDGLILIRPPEGGAAADVRMEMYNTDGSRGRMCGNGIRCVAKYAIDHGLVEARGDEPAKVRIQTDRGVRMTWATLRDGLVETVRVDMGAPITKPADIPIEYPGECCVKAPLAVGGESCEVTCVSMGNPHAVMFVASMDAVDLSHMGPLVECHAMFPNRVNFHIATIQSRGEATMRSWERGSGLTQACGTGACAVLTAGVLEGSLDRAARIHLPGGELMIEWADAGADDSGSLFMTGPAVDVFSGAWPT